VTGYWGGGFGDKVVWNGEERGVEGVSCVLLLCRVAWRGVREAIYLPTVRSHSCLFYVVILQPKLVLVSLSSRRGHPLELLEWLLHRACVFESER